MKSSCWSPDDFHKFFLLTFNRNVVANLQQGTNYGDAEFQGDEGVMSVREILELGCFEGDESSMKPDPSLVRPSVMKLINPYQHTQGFGFLKSVSLII